MSKSIHRYFLDLEFREWFSKGFLGLGKKRHVIDLISIGIVDQAGRSYHAISNEFDLKAVWNSYEVEKETGKKVYWMRDNVLYQIWKDLYGNNSDHASDYFYFPELCDFSYESMKRLIRQHGKSRKEIARDLLSFIYYPALAEYGSEAWPSSMCVDAWLETTEIRFFANYAAYDWVGFLSLFGTLMERPEGFPAFINDIQQIIQEKDINENLLKVNKAKRTDAHHALYDALYDRDFFNEIHFTPAVNRRFNL